MDNSGSFYYSIFTPLFVPIPMPLSIVVVACPSNVKDARIQGKPSAGNQCGMKLL